MDSINIAQKLASFDDIYAPKIVGELNDQYVKLVKFKGPYVMHKHDHEDEMFLVVKGAFDMQYKDRTVTIREGEFVIVPKGMEHCPNAKEEVHVMMFEPKTVVNTGDVESAFTIAPENLEKI